MQAIRPSRGGLKFEPRGFKDFSHEKVFGAVQAQEIKQLGRLEEIKKLNLPIVFQGAENTCVSCSVTFVKQYMEATGTNLAHEWLVEISQTGVNGATPKQVLEPARTTGICEQDLFDKTNDFYTLKLNADKHKIGNYFFIDHKDKDAVYAALKDGLLLIGVRDWDGVKGGHMMAAVDVTEDGSGLVCINWWKKEAQDTALVKWNDLVLAIAIKPLPENVNKTDARLDAFSVLASKAVFWLKDKRVLGALGGLTMLMTSLFGHDAMFGSGYSPVTNYDARTTQFISSSASTIPVNTTADKAGNEISLSNLSASTTQYAYFTLEPGTTREEIVACSGKSTGSWSSCLRGLAYQGGNLTTSSTLQSAHNAGSRMIMSDVGQFFSEFLSQSGDQTKFGTLAFNTFPRVTSTTGVPTSASQLATKYYVDTVGAGGFTASNVGTLFGLKALGTVPETVGINISTTSSGLYFDTSWTQRPLAIQTSSTGGLTINGVGSAIVDTSDSLTWTGNETFNGTNIFGGTTQYTVTPTSSSDVMSYQFSEGNYATGTAGTTIAAGKAVMISSTGTIILTNSAATNTVYEFIGISNTAANPGQDITYTRPGGIVRGLSGLTNDRDVFLNDTNGAFGITKGTITARIGKALSSTSMIVMTPQFFDTAVGSQNTAFSANTTNTIATIWIPTHVHLNANYTNAGCTGDWYRSSSGASQQSSFGTNNSTPFGGGGTNGVACRFADASNTYVWFVATTTNGFVIGQSGNTSGNQPTLTYYAEYTSQYDAH